MSQTVLVIEDEHDIRELLSFHLENEGFSVITAPDGEKGMELARKHKPDMILLDLLLPGIGGLDICRILKNDTTTQETLIVMLTAKDDESDIVVGLEVGADDYLTKPFSPKVVIAHVKAVLRRRGRETKEEDVYYKYGELEVDPQRHLVKVSGHSVDLTSTEFQMLAFLSRRPGWVFTRQQIVDAVRGEDYAVTERAVDVQIVGLRKKLGDHAALIETVRGVGYRFKE